MKPQPAHPEKEKEREKEERSLVDRMAETATPQKLLTCWIRCG
jgi:hypothetical protein